MISKKGKNRKKKLGTALAGDTIQAEKSLHFNNLSSDLCGPESQVVDKNS